MSRPTASSRIFSQDGMPVACVPFTAGWGWCPVGPGCGWCPVLAGGDAEGAGGCCWRGGAGRGAVGVLGVPGRGSVRTVPGRIVPGLGPTADRLAAYSAGQPPRTANRAAIPDRVSPAATVYRAGAAGPGSTSTVPGWIVPGSGPIADRLAAYSAGHPPRTANRAAMPASVSPSWTTYRGRGLGAVTGAAARGVLVKVILVLLCARVFAWAGR